MGKICCHKFQLVLVKNYFSRNKGPNSAEKKYLNIARAIVKFAPITSDSWDQDTRLVINAL